MAISFTGKKRIRKSFGRVPEVAPMPNLIEVQKSSYDHFLQMGAPPEQRANVGLQEVLKSVFPIRPPPEIAMIGSLGSCLRISMMVWMPSFSGMMMSVTMRSGRAR